MNMTISVMKENLKMSKELGNKLEELNVEALNLKGYRLYPYGMFIKDKKTYRITTFDKCILWQHPDNKEPIKCFEMTYSRNTLKEFFEEVVNYLK